MHCGVAALHFKLILMYKHELDMKELKQNIFWKVFHNLYADIENLL